MSKSNVVIVALLAAIALVAYQLWSRSSVRTTKENPLDVAESVVEQASPQGQVQSQDTTSAATTSLDSVQPTTTSLAESQPTGASAAPNATLPATTSMPRPSAPVQLGQTAAVLSHQEELEWKNSLPTRDEVRKEVASDTHHTPKTLTDLAPTFAKLMEDAETSVDGARVAFRKFELCAQDRDKAFVPSLRVACFTNAKRVAKKYPVDLGPSLVALEKNLDPETRGLARAYETL